MLWIKDPSILLTHNPFDDRTKQDRENTLAQVVLLGGGAVSAAKRSLWPLILALVFLLVNYLLFAPYKTKSYYTTSAMASDMFNPYDPSQRLPRVAAVGVGWQGGGCGAYGQQSCGNPQGVVTCAGNPAPPYAPAGGAAVQAWPAVHGSWMATQLPCQCQTNLNLRQTETSPTAWQSNAPVWGGFPSPQFAMYPNNPSKFDQPYAVRSRLPLSLAVTPDSSLAQMFHEPETYMVDRQIAPIPDPTLMARQPVCMQSPYITSNEMRDHGKTGWIR